MIRKTFRWLAANIGTIILSLFLAFVVWITAVITSDPNNEGVSNPIPLTIEGLGTNMFLIGDIPDTVQVTLTAPASIWNELNSNPDLIRATADLSGLGAGEHTVPVMVQIDANPVKILAVSPEEITLALEPLMTKELPVELIVNGEPPLGYQKEDPVIDPEVIQVSGPESAVEKVAQAKVTLDIAGASQSVTARQGVEILDESGTPVSGVTIRPQLVTVTQPISLLRGFRNVAVKVVTTGQVASGYRLTNIIVTPPTVTVSSDDPLLVNELPGFIETNPIDIEGLVDGIEVNVSLVLPEGILLIREPGVLVQIGVAAIESSLTIPLPIELIGLSPDLSAILSPPEIVVIVSGPIRVLEELTPASFRAVIDITNLAPGTYQISPVIDLLPELVQIESILPETVEVVISLAPTPTPTPNETISQTPTPRP